MAYEIVNKELDIYSCSIADLTAKQVSSFLDGWKEGAAIGTLTMFLIPATGSVVLNRDHKYHEGYKLLAETFLLADETERDRLEQKAPESFKEACAVLRRALIYRDIKNALQNAVDRKYRPVLDEICTRDQGYIIGAAYIAFRYGMMCGKREERTRRKRAALSDSSPLESSDLPSPSGKAREN